MPNTTTMSAETVLEQQILDNNQELVERYRHLLDAQRCAPITRPWDRYAMAQVFETTHRVLAAEATMNTTSVFGTSYAKQMLGMLRQIWPKAFGLQLVSVQPVDRPTAKIFSLKTLRDDNSTLGTLPADDNAAFGYSQYIASRDYAVHTNGEGGEIAKGMTLSIADSDIVINQVRKLKTSASWELSTDLQAYHNLNAMDVLKNAAVDEIAQELDARIVKQVRDAAIAHGTVTFGPAPSGYPAEKWPARLQRAILNAHQAIFASSLRHPNIMICGMNTYLELLDLSSFTMHPNVNWDVSGYGVLPIGSLNSQYQVYLSRACPDDEILLGRKGSGFLDAGIVYAPYVGLFITDRFFDVTTQKTVQSFAQRDGLFTISPTLFHRVRVDENAAAGIN